MILVVTEHNRWENEKWHYVFELEKQDCAAINFLMSFIRLANAHFEKVSLEMKGSLVFAASKYSMEFYDSIEINDDGVVLVHSKTRLHCRRYGSYTSNDWSGRLVISVSKIKSARDAMRDKKENVLYKSFFNCCYKRSISLSENINT